MLCKNLKRQSFSVSYTVCDREDTYSVIKADFFFKSFRIGRAWIQIYSKYDMTDEDLISSLGDNVSYIERIDIKDTWKNHGFGTLALEKICIGHGCVLAPDNARAKNLYTRIGDILEDGVLFDEFYALDQGYGLYHIRSSYNGGFYTGE